MWDYLTQPSDELDPLSSKSICQISVLEEVHVFGKADEFYDYGRDGFGYKPQEERVNGWGKGLQDIPSGCL